MPEHPSGRRLYALTRTKSNNQMNPKLSTRFKRSRDAFRNRTTLPDYPEIVFEPCTSKSLGGDAAPRLEGIVPAHDLSLFHATARIDTAKFTLTFSEPTTCNAVVALLRKAFGIQTKEYGYKFHVLGTGRDHRALLSGSYLRHRITVRDLSGADMLALGQIPGLAISPRVNRLDVAVDFHGGDVTDRRTLHTALALSYVPKDHVLEGRGSPRQVFKHPKTRRKTQLRLLSTDVDASNDRIGPYHHFIPIPEASAYFGSRRQHLETIIYHKVLDPNKERLPEDQQSVRVEARLLQKKLEERGIETLDGLLGWRPASLGKLFKFEVAARPIRNTSSAMAQLVTQWLWERLKERACTGVFAVLEQYRETMPRDTSVKVRRRKRKATLSYEKMNQRCANALQALSRKLEVEFAPSVAHSAKSL